MNLLDRYIGSQQWDCWQASRVSNKFAGNTDKNSSAARMNLIKKQGRIIFSLLIACLLLSGCSGVHYAHVESMLLTVSNQFPGIYRLITALAYLMGIAFIFRGVYQLKVYGDLRTMMSVQTNFKATMMVFFAGTALLYAPTAFKSMLLSTFATTTVADPMSYEPASSLSTLLASQAVLRFMQLIGTISFIKGWVSLTHVSNPNGRSTMGKAVTHIVAGLLAINIEGTKEMLQASFGMS